MDVPFASNKVYQNSCSYERKEVQFCNKSKSCDEGTPCRVKVGTTIRMRSKKGIPPVILLEIKDKLIYYVLYVNLLDRSCFSL